MGWGGMPGNPATASVTPVCRGSMRSGMVGGSPPARGKAAGLERGEGVAHRNPWKARLARWQKLWPRPIAEIQAQAFSVLMLAYEGVAVDDAEARRKNIHVYFTALATFTKLMETVALEDFDRRLTALEQPPVGSHRNGAFP
jgi:hypothetical protein